MKKKFIFIVILFFIIPCFSQNIDYSFQFSDFYKKFNESPNIVYLDDSLLFQSWYDGNDNLNKNYYLVYNIKKVNINHFIKNDLSEKQYFLEGKGIIVITYECSDLRIDFTKQKYDEWISKKNNEYFKNWIDKESFLAYYSIYDAGIKNINASSFLSENSKLGLIEYNPKEVTKKLYYSYNDVPDYISYDSLTPPWVEGVPGYGIGEYLDIEFKYESDEMQILNGFVDFTRMDLYSKNSRVKTLLIESENPKFSKEYELEDIVKYNVINLPAKTKKVRMTIKDVYKGDKYDDTCISSILVTNPNLPSYEEMSKKLLKAIKESGIKTE